MSEGLSITNQLNQYKDSLNHFFQASEEIAKQVKEHDRLVSQNALRDMIATAENLISLETTIIEYLVDEGVNPSGMTTSEIEKWIVEEESKNNILQVLCIRTDNSVVQAALEDIQNKVLNRSGDAAFESAVSAFVHFTDKGINMTDTENISKLQLIGTELGMSVALVLSSGGFFMSDEPFQTSSNNSQSEQETTEQPIPESEDKHPLFVPMIYTGGTLERSGSKSKEFSGKIFTDMINRSLPARRIMSVLVRYHVASAEQISQLSKLEGKKLSDALDSLSSNGFIDRYRYSENTNDYCQMYTLGELCANKSAASLINGILYSGFSEIPVDRIRTGATESLAATLSAFKRTDFLAKVFDLIKAPELYFPVELVNIGGVEIKANSHKLLFLCPYFDSAVLKEYLLQLETDETVIIVAEEEEIAEEWNLALANAKISGLHLCYQLKDCFIRSNFEPTTLNALFALPEPIEEKTVEIITEKKISAEECSETQNSTEEDAVLPESESEEIGIKKTEKLVSIQEQPTVVDEKVAERHLEITCERAEKTDTTVSDAAQGKTKVELSSKIPDPAISELKKNETQNVKSLTLSSVVLPVLPLRNMVIDAEHGIFTVQYPTVQNGASAEAILQPVYQMVAESFAPGAIVYSRALERCVPEFWKPVADMLSYSFDDPMLNKTYSYYHLQTVFERAVPGTSQESVLRFELSAFLRLLFCDEIEESDYYTLSYPVISKSLEQCSIFSQTEALQIILQELCSFALNMQKGFGPKTVKQVQDSTTVDQHRQALIEQAKEMKLLRLNECQAANRRVKQTREELFGPSSKLRQLITMVAEGSTENLQEGMEFCSRFLNKKADNRKVDRKKINEYIDSIWFSIDTSRNRNTGMTDTQRIPLGNNIENFILTFMDWSDLATLVQKKDDPVLVLRNKLIGRLIEAEKQIAAERDVRMDEYAGRCAVLAAIQNAKDILDYKQISREYFYIDFITNSEVELDTETALPIMDTSVSIVPGNELWTRVLRHQKAAVSLEDYIHMVFGEGTFDYDFGRRLLLFRYLRSLHTLPTGLSLQDIALQEELVQADVEKMSEPVLKMEEEFNAVMEMDEGYGRFLNLGEKDRCLHEFRDWHKKVAIHNCNFGFYQKKMKAYSNAVESDSAQLTAQYEAKLRDLRETLPADVRERRENNILDTISRQIELRQFSIADDYMRLAAIGHTAPPDSYMRSGNATDYFEQFLDAYPTLFRRYADAGRKLYEVYSEYNPEYTIRNRDQRSAKNFLQSWPCHDDSRDRRDMKLSELLIKIGFPENQIQVNDMENRRIPARGVRFIKPTSSNSEFEHPIAGFGSELTEQGITVLFEHGRTDRDMLMNTIRSFGSVGNPVLILLDYSLAITERRAIAAKQKREGNRTRTVILIDRILAVYLAETTESERMKAMLQCALPFSYMIPYQLSSSSVIPPDMFIGRRDELSSILSPSGTHIIYGGRQLGKTALLYRAKAKIHKPQDGYWAIYIKVLNQGKDEVPAEICRELAYHRFFDIDSTCTDWATLCSMIRTRMDDTENPVQFLMLLIDEADLLMSTSEEDEYCAIDMMLDLQTNTRDRFKFVLAGLHNVMRHSKKAMENNSSLMRLSPLAIKPLKYTEGSELLEKPLFYLGFRMMPEHISLVSQILSTCNYYPGLVHYYAYQLLSKMEINGANRSDAPPYYLDEAQIRNLLQDSSFVEQIKEKLFITLGVDAKEGNHYKILAYALAYCCHDKMEAASFGFSASEIIHVCADFSIFSIVRLGEYTVHSLLEEMVELNVLRMDNEKQYFSFNRRSFLEMLGDIDTVWKELEEFGDAD